MRTLFGVGSVRQVVDPQAEILLAQSYSPYGEMVSSVGDYATAYSYTGEMTDGTALVNLRTRYYDPGTGRFVNKDTWGGEYNNPITMNKPVALLLLSPQQAGGVSRKSKCVSHLKAWNRRCKQRGIQRFANKFYKWLNLGTSEIFPIHVKSDVEIINGLAEGIIDGFLYCNNDEIQDYYHMKDSEIRILN